MRIKMLTASQLGRELLPRRTVVELPDEEAQSLIDRKLAEVTTDDVSPVRGSFSATGQPKKTSDKSADKTVREHEKFARANARDAIAIVEATKTVEDLEALEKIENEREEPRKTVLEAIDTRVTEIAGAEKKS